jgi:tRNA1Val (adenine37-N6)-methyltransferase
VKSNSLIKEDECLDDLQLNGLMIIQKKKAFKFGIDAVLVANFASSKENDIVCDFGTGTGVIPLIFSAKNKFKKIYAFEIQTDIANLAKRNFEYNKLQEKIELVNLDIKNVVDYVGKSSVDVIISNPPYFKTGGAIVNENDYKAISRHEIKIDLEGLIRSGNEILKPNGSFYMIHRPDRLVDIMYYFRKYFIEPKLIQFVQPKAGKVPNLVIIKAVKNGKNELKYLPNLVVYNEDNTFTKEIDIIYGREG